MDIYAFLAQHGIAYERLDHPPVMTVDEAERLVPPGGGAATKNLFLRDEKGKRHFLVGVSHEKQVDLKRLSDVMGSTKVSFGSPERLRKHLGVEPGAVTLLGVVNDPEHKVEVFIDKDLWKADAIRCHPLVNTATLILPREELERVFQVTGHQYRLIDIPVRAS